MFCILSVVMSLARCYVLCYAGFGRYHSKYFVFKECACCRMTVFTKCTSYLVLFFNSLQKDT